MEERLEWEVEVRCEHSYNRRCAKTLKTRYQAAQVEKENKIHIFFFHFNAKLDILTHSCIELDLNASPVPLTLGKGCATKSDEFSESSKRPLTPPL